MQNPTLAHLVASKLRNALIKHAQKLPHELYESLIWDRGKVMADHKRSTLPTDGSSRHAGCVRL